MHEKKAGGEGEPFYLSLCMLPSGHIYILCSPAALQSVNANEHLCHLIGESLVAKVFVRVGLFSQEVTNLMNLFLPVFCLRRTFAHMHPEFVDKLIACNIPHPRLVPALVMLIYQQNRKVG